MKCYDLFWLLSRANDELNSHKLTNSFDGLPKRTTGMGVGVGCVCVCFNQTEPLSPRGVRSE